MCVFILNQQLLQELVHTEYLSINERNSKLCPPELAGIQTAKISDSKHLLVSDPDSYNFQEGCVTLLQERTGWKLKCI